MQLRDKNAERPESGVVLACLAPTLVFLGSRVAFVHWTQGNVFSRFLAVSYEGHSNVSLSPLFEDICVTQGAQNKKSHLALNKLVALFLGQNYREGQRHINWDTRPQNGTTCEKTRAFLDEKFFARPTVNVEPEKNIEVKRWRLTSLFNFDFCGHRAVNFEMMNRCLCEQDIGPQFSLGVLFSGRPKQNCIPGENSGEHSDKRSADQVNDDLIAITPREEAIFGITWFLIFTLPFSAAAVGYQGRSEWCCGLIVYWWVLTACVFLNVGGLWG